MTASVAPLSLRWLWRKREPARMVFGPAFGRTFAVFDRAAATTAPAGPIIYDTFTDTDGVSLDAHTPDTNSPGNPWVELNGVWEISSNRVIFNAAPNWSQAVIDAEMADLTVEAVCRLTGTYGGGLIVRLSDDNNFWLLQIDNNSDTLILYEINGGGATNRAQAAVSIAINTDYAVKMTTSGTTITAWLDGANEISYNSATFNQTSTRVGLAQNSGQAVFDDFTVTA